MRPLRLSNPVAGGGFHSVALTRAGWPRIVQVIANRHRVEGVVGVIGGGA